MEKIHTNEGLLIVLGDQLFPSKYIDDTGCRRIFMAEDLGLCRQTKHHKLKILMFFTAMRAYRDEMLEQGFEVFYHSIAEADFSDSFEEKLERVIVSNEISEIHHFANLNDRYQCIMICNQMIALSRDSNRS